MKNNSFREWLNKNYTIYKSRWVLKKEIRRSNFIEPISYSYDELHKIWLENVKDKVETHNE